MAAIVWLYVAPTVVAGRLEVAIVTPETTLIDKAFVAVADTLSVTLAVKFAVPDEVGMPVIAPVAATRDNPPGRLPERTDHVTGAVPPADAIV